jgi:hypothetical protein
MDGARQAALFHDGKLAIRRAGGQRPPEAHFPCHAKVPKSKDFVDPKRGFHFSAILPLADLGKPC